MGADRSIPRLGGLIQSWYRVDPDRAWLAFLGLERPGSLHGLCAQAGLD